MFQDEAGFGRINKPKYCWCRKGIRPSVPCHHIREYRYACRKHSIHPCKAISSVFHGVLYMLMIVHMQMLFLRLSM